MVILLLLLLPSQSGQVAKESILKLLLPENVDHTCNQMASLAMISIAACLVLLLLSLSFSVSYSLTVSSSLSQGLLFEGVLNGIVICLCPCHYIFVGLSPTELSEHNRDKIHKERQSDCLFFTTCNKYHVLTEDTD